MKLVISFLKIATDVALADFELTVEANLWGRSSKLTTTIKADITLFSESEKQQLGKVLQEGKSIYFITEAFVIDEPTDWKLEVRFEIEEIDEWNLVEISDNSFTESTKPNSNIEMKVDLKMKFSYKRDLPIIHLIHFQQQVIEPIKFGSQAGKGMPAQWNAELWLPVQPILLFRWMDYAHTWEDFTRLYPTIRLADGNSNMRTYTTTHWEQETSSGVFPTVNTDTITSEPDNWVPLAHSTAVSIHGEQHVSFGMIMYVYLNEENIYATFQLSSESTFTYADQCQPGASASVYIGYIALE